MINQKFKLYLNKEQEKTLEMYQSHCKLVWNLALHQRENYWEQCQKYGIELYRKAYPNAVSEYGQSADLTKLKKEFDFLYQTPSETLTNVLTMLDLSYKQFFKNLKTNSKLAGKPRFKGRKDSIGIKFKGKKWPLTHLNGKNYSSIILPKIGSLRFRQHKEIMGEIKNCMIKKEAHGWFITICVDYEIEKENTSSEVVGIDRGVTQAFTTSNGDFINYPEYIKEDTKRIKVLQRRMRNKSRGSANSKKAYRKIAKLQAKIARQKDYFIKLNVHILTTSNKMVAIEDLKISNMTKSAKGTIENPGVSVKAKSGLNREILNKNWGAFATKLKEKGKQNGCKIVEVNPRFTSQKCSSCGTIHKDNRKTQSDFECVSCNFKINADVNAAINIKHLALAGEVSVEMPEKIFKKIKSGSMKQKCSTQKDKNTRDNGGLNEVYSNLS